MALSRVQDAQRGKQRAAKWRALVVAPAKWQGCHLARDGSVQPGVVYTLRINIYTRDTAMPHAIKTAAVFKSGNSQAVRLPKEFQFDVSQVEILRRGDDVVLRRIPANLAAAFDLLAALPDDFMQDGRNDTPPQVREGL